MASLGLVACGGDEPAPIPTPTVTVDATVDPEKTDAPEPVLPTVLPLTGVEVDEVPARPAIAIKVENTAASRPQSGLEDADVVWETVVEFQVSRFVAVYHSTVPESVGPVRSARPVDLQIVTSLKPLFVSSGAQSRMVTRIGRVPEVQSIMHDKGAAGLGRVSSRRAPHNVYADLATIWKAADADHSEPPAQSFEFAREAAEASAVVDGEKASTIDIRLTGAARPSWTWDSGDDVWLRSEGSTPATSATGGRLGATNVVLIETRQIDSTMDAQGGAMIPDQEFTGTGKALVATGGRVVEATWEKKDAASPVRLVDGDGEPVLLAPGNTWVEMLNKGLSSYTIE